MATHGKGRGRMETRQPAAGGSINQSLNRTPVRQPFDLSSGFVDSDATSTDDMAARARNKQGARHEELLDQIELGLAAVD